MFTWFKPSLHDVRFITDDILNSLLDRTRYLLGSSSICSLLVFLASLPADTAYKMRKGGGKGNPTGSFPAHDV